MGSLREFRDKGILTDSVYYSLTRHLCQWWKEKTRKALIESLDPEFQDLIRTAGKVGIFSHCKETEMETLVKLYGEPYINIVALNAVLEIGYKKGVRAERKRIAARQAKSSAV